MGSKIEQQEQIVVYVPSEHQIIFNYLKYVPSELLKYVTDHKTPKISISFHNDNLFVYLAVRSPVVLRPAASLRAEAYGRACASLRSTFRLCVRVDSLRCAFTKFARRMDEQRGDTVRGMWMDEQRGDTVWGMWMDGERGEVSIPSKKIVKMLFSIKESIFLISFREPRLVVIWGSIFL